MAWKSAGLSDHAAAQMILIWITLAAYVLLLLVAMAGIVWEKIDAIRHRYITLSR